MKVTFAVGAILGALLLLSVAAPRERTVAVSVNPRPIPSPGIQDIISAIDLAWNGGARASVLTERWSVLEPKRGTYKLDDFTNGMNYFGTMRGFQLYIGIQLINTTVKETPADLSAIAFDDHRMKQRFHQLIDKLRPWLHSDVKYISIGNEVDVYLAAHPEEWPAYQNFYEDAVAYVHRVAPWVKVGVTVTFSGAKDASAGDVARLVRKSDVYLLTYYPLHGDFLVDPPTAPLTDVPEMVRLAGRKPLILQEAGYPSDPVLGSSDEAQATFVSNMYKAWQDAGSRIPLVNFFLMHDLTPDLCYTFAQYYGLQNDSNFKAFLCSLGLRRSDGAAKPGWDAFVAGAR